MTDKTMYYAVYDITDDTKREAVIQILKDAGLVRIQKSVFCGGLVSQQRKDLIEMVKLVIDADNDSFYLIMSCSKCFKNTLMIGKGFDTEYVEGKRGSMVF